MRMSSLRLISPLIWWTGVGKLVVRTSFVRTACRLPDMLFGCLISCVFVVSRLRDLPCDLFDCVYTLLVHVGLVCVWFV